MMNLSKVTSLFLFFSFAMFSQDNKIENDTLSNENKKNYP